MNQEVHAMRRRSLLRQISAAIMLILILLLLIQIPFQDFHILGHSMEPTLHDQEFIMVNKAAYLFQPPAHGDVIVFQNPLNRRENFVKRIIAIPGDIISIIGQAVIVDGVILHETYVNKDDANNPYMPIIKHIIGPNQYFVMGDNRGNSSDSRAWGLVPRSNILGKAIVIYWPSNMNNLGFLPDASSVFAQVHQ